MINLFDKFKLVFRIRFFNITCYIKDLGKKITNSVSSILNLISLDKLIKG